ncbi:homoserine dehydrogenase [Alicyclobacillus mali (ex Roth et al. 2021)]|uniref:homoserine dehydrogenase n=1 Tax=Alicyclobacillus mali (ex Roth et al. 2021) TaxID=1123961 RepID=UPI001E6408D8|nr:homoserine dehydrogenase [Alicyclobacillus mali (ex Roth et al. 2021)]
MGAAVPRSGGCASQALGMASASNTSHNGKAARDRLKRVRLGLIGCGVVGSGVLRVLSDRAGMVGGMGLEATRIAVKHLSRPRPSYVPKERLTDDWRSVCLADDVDVVIEVMGGIDVAHEVVRTAIRAGKPVVTANKALMAAHGPELRALARDHGVAVRYEASVLGGVPAIHTLQTYFRVNRVTALRGIVNGTSNYILTRMTHEGASFADALAEAQALGYAEPDPTSDVEGHDAFFKLQVLLQVLGVDTAPLRNEVHAPALEPRPLDARLAAYLAAPREGISHLRPDDVLRARSRGEKLKHVATARWREDGVVETFIRVESLPPSDPLFGIDGVENALAITGDVVGTVTLTGPGAGAFPTASAVLEDVVQLVEVPHAGNASVEDEIEWRVNSSRR